jgi:peptide chain release factor 1
MALGDNILSRLDSIKIRFDELTEKTYDMNVINDKDEWKKVTKERSSIEPVTETFAMYKKLNEELENIRLDIKAEKDSEMRDFMREESKNLEEQVEKISDEIKILLLPHNEDDEKNVIIEIRAGAGGDEAGLFVADLYRMYTRYAERKRWKTEVLDISESGIGAIKSVSFLISAQDAYGKLKYESGVHRVQRVPETEAQGRVHTSTVTVAVLAEAKDVDVVIRDQDLRIDKFRSTGAGGQNVNKTESAIRITHLPTGLVVECQDERSQLQNKERAMMMIQTKLYDFYKSQADKEYSDIRKNQVGTGDRSERIRTYNFPQGRVTDHRINLTVYTLDMFMDGDLEEMLVALRIADQQARLEGQQ